MNSSKELQKRIESLNRGKLKVITGDKVNLLEKRLSEKNEKTDECSQVSPILYQRTLPTRSSRIELSQTIPHRSYNPSNIFRSLSDALPGTEIITGSSGAAYKIVSYPCEEIETLSNLPTEFENVLVDRESNLNKTLSMLFDKVEIMTPKDIIFLDIETTGLGCNPLFLIGIMVLHEGKLEVRQFLARDYSEERAVINCFIDEFVERKLLITFNGKTFDLPFIKTRAVANALHFEHNPFHLDMLHQGRRIYRGHLPNCKLQTLELHVCGRSRYGDIPGSEIPEAYHEYVRTQNAVELAEIIKHNMLDLITLADLMVRMPFVPKKRNPSRRPRKEIHV